MALARCGVFVPQDGLVILRRGDHLALTRSAAHGRATCRLPGIQRRVAQDTMCSVRPPAIEANREGSILAAASNQETFVFRMRAAFLCRDKPSAEHDR